MITNAALLKVFLSKENTAKYKEYVSTDWLTRECAELFRALLKYHTIVEGDVELEAFAEWFNVVLHPDMPRSKRDEYYAIIKKIGGENLTSFGQIFDALEEERLKDNLRQMLDDEDQEFDVEKVVMLTKNFKRFEDKAKELHVTNDLSRLLTANHRDDGLKWRLGCLKRAVRPLGIGDFVIIAGFVNAGKTAMTISEITYMARQLESGRVLWLNNEEYDDRVYKKIWMSLLGVNWRTITDNPDKAQKLYSAAMHGDMDRIQLFNIRNKSVRDILAICNQYDPRLIVIDQIDKVHGGNSKDGAEHNRLTNLYGEMRTIANTVAPVIAVSQADASVRHLAADGTTIYHRHIDQTQLAGSKVGKPGEADVIITIGQDKDFPRSRYISTPKLKDDPDKALRAYEVMFDGELCRYTDPLGDN